MKKFDGLETKQKWCVVIDTCNIEGDFRLRSGGLLYLLHACRATNVQVYFPRVCVSDLIAHYHIKSAESLKAYKQAYAELDRYVYKGRPPPFFEGLGQLDENYDNWLLKRIKELRISILDYPNITHEKIITRATGKKRPFTNHDRGYKDTLIWESVLELLQSRNSHVIFITRDKDFVEGNGLHKDLLQDLNTLGVNDFQVKMAQNYESAIEYLDKTLGVRSKLDEEKRAEWAGVTSATLKKAIPFKHVFDNAIGYLEHELMEHAEWFKSHLEPLTLSVKDGIQVQTTEFEANYVGEGVWRVDGEALIQTKVEYVTSYSNHGPAEETQEMFLTIGFTIYFDYPKMKITDVILRGVKQ